MAEALKHQLGPDLPRRVAAALHAAHPPLDVDAFEAFCLDGWDDLELTPRGQRIADAMAEFLPDDRSEALRVVIASLDHGPNTVAGEDDGNADTREDEGGWASWFYLAHTRFVADHGLDHFELAMEAQYRLTQLFTAEFSIRPFLAGHPAATLDRLATWTGDPSHHVRRLVSEGTRTRLPWAGRLSHFIDDPTPVLELLEALRHDTSEYVRRSVANNLNDLAKDHPELVVSTARRWWNEDVELPAHRRRMIRHGLRTLIKQAHSGALEIMGFHESSPVKVLDVRITPVELAIGDKLKLEADVQNPSDGGAGALVDFVVHFVKANGSTSPKVFKGAELQLAAGETATVRKTISLAQHSTRTHYPGRHAVELQCNGSIVTAAEFTLSR